MSEQKSYTDGLLEGRLMSIENVIVKMDGRVDSQSRRLRILERIVWAIMGGIGLIEFTPTIQKFLGG